MRDRRMLKASLVLMVGSLLIGLCAFNANAQVRNVNILADGSVTVTASSTSIARDYNPLGAFDGDRSGLGWEHGAGWNSNVRDGSGDTLTATLAHPKVISLVIVTSLQDAFTSPIEPDVNTTCSLYCNLDYDVQGKDYTTGAWVTLAQVRGNTHVLNVIPVTPTRVTAVQFVGVTSRSHFFRVIELEGYGEQTGN